MRLYNKEMKGTDLSRNHFNPGITKATVARCLNRLIINHDISVFVTAANTSSELQKQLNFIPSNENIGIQAKDVARELLVGGFSDMLDDQHQHTVKNLLIWDLSDNNELSEFSKIVDSFKPSSAIIPHILGGLSHEWAELQIADLVSNFAINYITDGIYPDSDKEKSEAFREFLYPILYQRNGVVEGLKVMRFDCAYD